MGYVGHYLTISHIRIYAITITHLHIHHHHLHILLLLLIITTSHYYSTLNTIYPYIRYTCILAIVNICAVASTKQSSTSISRETEPYRSRMDHILIKLYTGYTSVWSMLISHNTNHNHNHNHSLYLDSIHILYYCIIGHINSKL